LLSLRGIILGLCSFVWATHALAGLQLDCYQSADKALTVHAGGHFVDPYFANRALITAHQLGLDIQPVARQWIEWALAHQSVDGRFGRYCLHGTQQWQRCAAADADDASLALWQQLLYLVSARDAQYGAWHNSVQRARQQLDHLYDARRGIYLVSSTQRFGLLMDNVEIYNALSTIARQQRDLGATSLAAATLARAKSLHQAINRVFWRSNRRTYAVTTQAEEPKNFYPHIVAQVYPWLFDLPTPVNTQQAYRRWHARYAERWLSFTQDKYPWGLVAATAYKLGDRATAERWLRHAGTLRHGRRWNILEEAIYQALAREFAMPVTQECKRGES
jgi:hypothetical protein